MNIELREHEIQQIIRETCDVLGVGIRETCDQDMEGAALHFHHRYDVMVGLRKRQHGLVWTSAIAHLLAGMAVSAALITGSAWAWGAAGFLVSWMIYSFVKTSGSIDANPITEQELEYKLAQALQERGYCVQLQDGQMSVWWREVA